MSWFDVDKAGLAAMLERRGKSFAIFELVQNAWDAGATEVSITLVPSPGEPYATLIVRDNAAEGWADLDDAFTMFKRSRRAGDPQKRGRFCLGEKLVLSLCRAARIVTTSGCVLFDGDGRRKSASRTEIGTEFHGNIRMTREELAAVEVDVLQLIPPKGCTTAFNGVPIVRPELLKTFEAKLPTEIADVDGNLRRSHRIAFVEVFETLEPTGGVLEMGVPVCSGKWPWRLNVQQKVPLNMERDAVTDAFRKALQVAALNAMADAIDEESAAKPWASEAIGDARVAPDALRTVITKRFGERAVIATPGEPIANATAEANGCQVIHGGALSADVWANIRKNQTLPTTGQAFPQPKPDPDAPQIKTCPLCKQAVD